MDSSRDWQTELPLWLEKQALPLWSTVGVDTATGTVWEALDHAGVPLAGMERRLRVQVRQAYCFAKSDIPAQRDLALQLFRFAMNHGFDTDSGLLASRLAPDTSILKAPHDLYDIAFMLLAASTLIEAGFDVHRNLERLEAELDKLKAPRGWYESAARDLPRRQNPHMHMFETSTALFAATGELRFRDMAEECLGLFREVFLTEDSRVLEYFDGDWVPLTGDAQVIEPGHMAEWVYLLDRYETVTGQASGVALPSLFAAVWARCDAGGLLPDQSEPVQSDSRRLWPQTELLKAGIALSRRGVELPAEAQPDAVLVRMWQQYLETEVPGGWYDKRSLDGVLLSDNMPASTFYHILVALRFYLSGGTSI